MVFSEEQRRADTSSDGSNAGEHERPAEPVVGVAWHPLIAIAEDREDNHAEASADADSEQEVSRDLGREKRSAASGVEGGC